MHTHYTIKPTTERYLLRNHSSKYLRKACRLIPHFISRVRAGATALLLCTDGNIKIQDKREYLGQKVAQETV